MKTPRQKPALVFLTFLALAGIVALIALGAPAAKEAAPLNGASLAPRRTNADATPPAIPFDSTTPRLVIRALKAIPHDTSAFTEGLLFTGRRLLESTGLEGRSDIRDVDTATGAVRRRVALGATLFGEGIAVVGQRLYQLTWQAGRGFVYDAASLAPTDSFYRNGRLFNFQEMTQGAKYRFEFPDTGAVVQTATLGDIDQELLAACLKRVAELG